jgi:hypothetical protein
MARAAARSAFLIAGPLSGHVVAGSSGRDSGAGLPALVSRPRPRPGWHAGPRLAERHHDRSRPTRAPAETETLVYDYPGTTDEWVVLSRHVDGHDLAESAMDNGTGLACGAGGHAGARARSAQWRRGLRVMFFSVEEWALTGSAQYVQRCRRPSAAKIALNINLDSVAGSPNLAA